MELMHSHTQNNNSTTNTKKTHNVLNKSSTTQTTKVSEYPDFQRTCHCGGTGQFPDLPHTRDCPLRRLQSDLERTRHATDRWQEGMSLPFHLVLKSLRRTCIIIENGRRYLVSKPMTGMHGGNGDPVGRRAIRRIIISHFRINVI